MNYYFNCPRCKSYAAFHEPTEDTGSTGCLLFLLGGFIPFLIFSRSRARRVLCGACNHIFAQPALPSTSVAKNFKVGDWFCVIICFGIIYIRNVTRI